MDHLNALGYYDCVIESVGFYTIRSIKSMVVLCCTEGERLDKTNGCPKDERLDKMFVMIQVVHGEQLLLMR